MRSTDFSGTCSLVCLHEPYSSRTLSVLLTVKGIAIISWMKLYPHATRAKVLQYCLQYDTHTINIVKTLSLSLTSPLASELWASPTGPGHLQSESHWQSGPCWESPDICRGGQTKYDINNNQVKNMLKRNSRKFETVYHIHTVHLRCN